MSKRTSPLRGTWRYDKRKRTSPTNASSGQEAENRERSSKIAGQAGRQGGIGSEARLARITNPGLIPDETAFLLPPYLCSVAESEIPIDLSALEILFLRGHV